MKFQLFLALALFFGMPLSATTQAYAQENDFFDHRSELKGAEASGTADNRNAKIEPGEPIHSIGYSNNRTLWWKWKAPATGKLTIDAIGSTTQRTALAIYIGDDLEHLTPVARWDDANNRFRFSFQVAMGQEYEIVSNDPSGGNSPYVGKITINLHFKENMLPAPVVGTDKFADRLLLKGMEAMAEVRNDFAGIEPGEPTHLPGYNNNRTVWWKWKAPATGEVTFDAIGSGASRTQLTVYIGDDLDTLVPVAFGDEANDKFQLKVQVAANQEYQIVSNDPSGGNSSYYGMVVFNLHCKPNDLPAPVVGMDKFADRPSLSGSEAMGTALNNFAGIEPGEPVHLQGYNNNRTVWWKWKASESGTVIIDAKGSYPSRTNMIIYTGDTLDKLIRVAGVDNTNDRFLISFKAVAGQEYQIVCNDPSGGNSSYLGRIVFNLHFHQ